jgi:hypothetical protein
MVVRKAHVLSVAVRIGTVPTAWFLLLLQSLGFFYQRKQKAKKE